MLLGFAAIFGISIVSVTWLAVRADSPGFVRGSLDFLMHVASGGLVAYIAFRALFLYPFRTLDLLVIVLVLSLGMKLTLDMLDTFGKLAVGLKLRVKSAESDEAGTAFQFCLIAGSILLLGGAWGLRSCALLKIERASTRALAVAAGMLAIPAGAGLAAFPVLILSHVLREETSAATTEYLILWLVCIAATTVNVVYFIRAMTLNTEIQARENLP